MRALAVLAGTLALAACTSVPTTPGPATAPAPVDAEQRQAAHEAAVGLADGRCALPAWALRGRVAVSTGRDGGSGRIDWTQGQGRTEVALSAPVTRQSWQLTRDPAGARLDGLAGGPRTGQDAAELLQAATGWTIPVDALGCWVRGARADTARFGPATLRWGPDGRLAGLVQDGWTLDISQWQPQAGGVMVPTRIAATRGEARVRLIVDRWSAARAP